MSQPAKKRIKRNVTFAEIKINEKSFEDYKQRIKALDFPKYLAYNADLAKQIFNLKDGEKVKLTVKNLKEGK